MTTAIAVTSPELVLPPPDGHTPDAVVLPAPGRPLGAVLAATRDLLERYGYLVALYPASVPAAVKQRLHTVRSVLESDRIALVQTELPPLGLAVLVRQLRQLSATDLSPGVLASAVRLLAHYVHAGAVLGSVARLDRVPVPLTSHARSWMPGSQFAVVASPTPQLVRVGPAATLRGPDYLTQLTTAAGQLTSGYASTTLAAQWQVTGVEQTALPPESARWWGTGKLVEFAAAIPDLSVLYQLVSSVQRAPCHWCGLELIGDRCAFCAAPLRATAPADAPTSRATRRAPAAHRPALDPHDEDDTGTVITHGTAAPAAVVPYGGATGALPDGAPGSAPHDGDDGQWRGGHGTSRYGQT
ncbi:hypothetical protein V1J52_06330 [Streptomyces sp. TRM 70351]|uniref:hypothetical protein n=1 Tax=Streptomyces sp. TRM 70351 TaxID=3116552 RepID=UPI002E7B8ABD|nr:hypothetical protein [Streptomyces sp. TRM 70351]MEE1927811.1 hypothetical protein [Streptomyces sp. TRM 70351]